jgi:DNA-binding CsgD family transcriptional regulator
MKAAYLHGMMMLKNLGKHIDLIAHTIENPESWTAVLNAVVKDCGLNSGMFFLQSNEQPDDTLALYNVGISDEMIESYYNTYFKKSRFLSKLYERERGRFWNIKDLSDEWESSPIYQEWCIPQGIRNVAATLIDVPGRVTLRLQFHSNVSQGLITEEQIEYLNLLVSHFQRAIDYHQQFSIAKGYYKAATYFIESYPAGAILLNGDQNVVYANEEAKELCKNSGLVSLTHKEISLRIASQQAEFKDLLSQCILEKVSELSSTTFVARDKDGKAVLEFNLLPFDAEEYRFGKEQRRPLLMLRLRDIAATPVVNGEALTKLFGLTEKERRVALMLSSGANLEEISEETCTSLNTVRTHLKSLFRKTSSNSQQQLVIKLLAVIPEGSFERH